MFSPCQEEMIGFQHWTIVSAGLLFFQKKEKYKRWAQEHSFWLVTLSGPQHREVDRTQVEWFHSTKEAGIKSLVPLKQLEPEGLGTENEVTAQKMSPSKSDLKLLNK